jgi:hypothetical protein
MLSRCHEFDVADPPVIATLGGVSSWIVTWTSFIWMIPYWALRGQLPAAQTTCENSWVVLAGTSIADQ